MKDAAKKRVKRTLEEEERELLATPAGQENWQKHQQKAEELYQRSLNAEKPVPVAHRGLGMLYEKLARGNDAAAEYEKYLELSPSADGAEAGRVATCFCFDKTSATIFSTRKLNSSDSAAMPSGPFILSRTTFTFAGMTTTRRMVVSFDLIFG
jgi:hypothetical protein